MEDTMMGTVEKLQETLHTLHSKLTPLAKAEVDALLALKKAQLESQHGSGNGVDANVNLYVWDRVYYNKVQNRQKYALDGAKVSEYFEVNRVISEMLKVFEELFGMEFVPMPNLDTWHETVSPFSVWDSASEGGEFLGYFFLDIFGRPGKFPLQYHSRIQPVS
jgi:metallopeptidase MepB